MATAGLSGTGRAAALLLGLGLAAAPSPAIEVTTFADEMVDNDVCSLREAVEAANGTPVEDACDTTVMDVILRDPGTYVLSLADMGVAAGDDLNRIGDLDVFRDLTLIGGTSGQSPADFVIDARGIDRVFDVHSMATARLTGVTVTGGRTATLAETPSYAEADFGGGIRNAGTLEIERCEIVGNQAGSSSSLEDDFAAANLGGGIYSSGPLTLVDSTVAGNVARGVDAFSDTVPGGEARGGGIYATAGLTLSNSTLSGNTAQGGQGASDPVGSDGGNARAGGLRLAGAASVTLNNVTVTANVTAGGAGGSGIGSASDGVGLGGGLESAAGTIHLGNTIVSGNTADSSADCASSSSGSVVSLGYNVAGTGCPAGGAGDVAAADPRLGILADNGGPTRTHAPDSDSPALLAGSPTAPGDPGPPPGCETTDQRGVTRPQGGRCDIGAYEAADLLVTQSVTDPSTGNPIAGEELTYEIQVRNVGLQFAFDTVITDDLADGLTATATTGCLESPAAALDDDGNLTCNLGTLGPFASRTATVTAAIDPGLLGTVLNRVTVSTSTATINSVTDFLTTTVRSEATLSITHTPVSALAAFDELVDYVIVVHNAGPSSARDVAVTDVLNSNGLCAGQCVEVPGVAPLAAAATAGCTEDPIGGRDGAGNPTCTLGTVAPGVPSQFTLTARVGLLDDENPGQAEGTRKLESTARVSTSTCPPGMASCPDPVAEATAGIDVRTEADLSITASDNALTAVAGQRLTYTLVASNQIGPNAVAGAIVTDTFAAPLEDCFWTCMPAGGALCTAGEVTGDIADTVKLPVGAAATYRATCTIAISTTAAVVTNMAAVAAPDGVIDADTANDSATDTTEIVLGEADLEVKKSASPAAVIAGQTLTYTLKVTNRGPDTARDVELVDVLPGGVTLTSASSTSRAMIFADGFEAGSLASWSPRAPTRGSSCSEASGQVTCDLGILASGRSATVTLVTAVDDDFAGTLTNTATVSATETDADDSNNAASVDTAVGAAVVDLALAMSDAPDPAAPGGALAYTLTVTNDGPSNATGVVLEVPLPPEVAFAAASAGCGASDNLVTCDLGSLAAGASESVSVTVDVSADATVAVTTPASVFGDQIEANALDNTATEVTTLSSR